MPPTSVCPVDDVLRTIGDRWSLGIVHVLSTGPRRTLDLHRAFTGLSTKTLAERLKVMGRQGLVQRTSYKESPPRVEYSLTEKGLRLLPVIAAIMAASHVLNGAPAPPTCAACGELLRDKGLQDRGEGVSVRERGQTVTAGPAEGEPRLSTSSGQRKRPDVTLL